MALGLLVAWLIDQNQSVWVVLSRTVFNFFILLYDHLDMVVAYLRSFCIVPLETTFIMLQQGAHSSDLGDLRTCSKRFQLSVQLSRLVDECKHLQPLGLDETARVVELTLEAHYELLMRLCRWHVLFTVKLFDDVPCIATLSHR